MASPRIVPTGVLGGQKGDKGERGGVGPSGGPFPDLTGVTSGKVPQTTGGGGVEFIDLTASIAAAVPPLVGVAENRQKARARAATVRSVGFFGDSLTNNNGDAGIGFKNLVPLLCRGRITRGVNISAGGVTVREWLTAYAATFNGLTTALLPGRASVMLGTNDVGRGGYDINTSRADLIELYDLLEARGVLPIACTILPRNDSAGANVVAYNTMVKTLAAARGYTLADYYATMVNGSGGIDSTYMLTSDTVHINAAGYTRASLAVFPTYRDSAPAGLAATAGQVLRKRNLDTNGLFATAGGKYNGVPSQPDYPLGFSVNENAPGAFITDTLAEGRWYSFRGAASGSALHQGAVLGVTPGNRYSVTMLVRLVGVEANAGTVYCSTEFRQASYGGSSNPNGIDVNAVGGGFPQLTTDLNGQVLTFYWESTAPSDAGMIFINVNSNKVAAEIRLAEIEVVDLTAQALA